MISYLLSEVVALEFLDYVIGISSIAIILLTVNKAGPLYRWVGLSFLVLAVISYITVAPVDEPFLSLFGSLAGLLALLFLLPCMSVVIAIGRYDQALGNMISNGPRPTATTFYKRTSLVTYMLTLFLNVATIPVVVSAVSSKIKSLGKEKIQQFFSHSLLRAYAFVLLWSPTEILVAASIDITGQSYLTLLPTLFVISILFMSVDWYLHSKRYKGVHIEALEAGEGIGQKQLAKKLRQMALAITVFILLVLLFNSFGTQTFLFTVTILIVPFTFGWALFLKRGKRFRTLAFSRVKGNARQMHGLFFLFLSAGFFVEVFPYTGVFDQLQTMLHHMYENYTVLLFYAIIGFFIFGLALIGFHPLISIALITPFLGDVVAAYPYGVSVLLIGAGLCTIMIGPLNVTPTVLAMQLNVNPYAIIKRNIPFALTFLTFIILVAYGFSVLLG
ncbi:hypothetical protein HUG15_22285 [Salicibibacter cibarius]|uniref:DUF401 family protein n=1 Tax=Salicibibacter cibarius TaxID=2743000 RepID=A0A7T6Z6S6_9BACI|nr:hypothetical protein HUG15_22285 [Salicibibacter cibarius]